jgi:hypothetical protein
MWGISLPMEKRSLGRAFSIDRSTTYFPTGKNMLTGWEYRVK